MKSLTPNEVHTLELFKKDNFRGVTKDNVLVLTSIFEKLDPEVAKALIEQLPEAVKGMVEIEQLYSNLLIKGVESCYLTANSCFNTEDKIVDVLAEEVKKDIPFEQKQYFVDQMVGAASRKGKKDTEHRAIITEICKCGLMALFLGVGVGLVFFLGGSGGNPSSNYHL